MTKLRLPIALALTALVSLALVACGGDDEGGASDADPQELVDAAFDPKKGEIESADISVSISADITGEQGGKVDLSLSGPISSGDDADPEFDLDLSVSADVPGQKIDLEAGATLVGDDAFVEVDGTNYKLPAAVVDQFISGLTQAAGADGVDLEKLGTPDDVAKLGLDPATWLTELTNEGTEDVAGTSSVHVSGEADLGKIAEDLLAAAEQLGASPGGIDSSQIGLIEAFVDEASFDVWTGEDDGLIRKLEVSLELGDLPGVGGGGESGSASFQISVELTGVNEEQEISAPDDSEPFSALIANADEILENLGLGDLGDLGDLGAFGSGGSGSGGGGNSGDGKGADLGDVPIPEDLPGVSQEYLDCIAGANSPEKIAECAKDLIG